MIGIMVSIIDKILDVVENAGILSPILACFFITIESILPFLPLAVFITINFISFGTIVGFLISWIFTVIGCMISFTIFRKGFNNKFSFLIKNRKTLESMMYKINNMKLSSIILLLAIPFTPAFMINIAAGLSNIPTKKYFTSLLIGKISLVFFWGYIGTSLIESIKNPIILAKIIIIVLVVYLFSRLIENNIND